MDAPDVTSITPPTGNVSGQQMVRIVGARFRLPFAPLPVLKQPPVSPSVRVLFGEEESPQVYVLSSTEIRAVTPPSFSGAVSVRVENLERDGSPVPGEYGVLENAFTYARSDLSVKGDEGQLALVTRTLRKLLAGRFLANTNITVHTDFDGTPESEMGHLEIASLPSVVLTGPKCVEDRRRSRNKNKTRTDVSTGTVYELPPTYTVIASYTIIVLTDNTRELHTLQAELMRFMRQNTDLRVPAEEGGFVELEMRFQPGQAPSALLTPSDSNVRQFNAMIDVLGVDIDGEGDLAVAMSAPVTDQYTPPGAAATSPGAGVVITYRPKEPLCPSPSSTRRSPASPSTTARKRSTRTRRASPRP